MWLCCCVVRNVLLSVYMHTILCLQAFVPSIVCLLTYPAVLVVHHGTNSIWIHQFVKAQTFHPSAALPNTQTRHVVETTHLLIINGINLFFFAYRVCYMYKMNTKNTKLCHFSLLYTERLNTPQFWHNCLSITTAR